MRRHQLPLPLLLLQGPTLRQLRPQRPLRLLRPHRPLRRQLRRLPPSPRPLLLRRPSPRAGVPQAAKTSLDRSQARVLAHRAARRLWLPRRKRGAVPKKFSALRKGTPRKSKTLRTQPQILIFDVDGVLVDVRGSYWRSALETVRYLTGKRVTHAELRGSMTTGAWWRPG